MEKAQGEEGVAALEEFVRIDFSSLSEEDRVAEPAEYETSLDGQLKELSRNLEGMAPNMKALTQYEEVQGRLHAMEGEFEQSRNAAKSVSQQFAAIQAKRHARFMNCFKCISEGIDETYKLLTEVEGVPLGTAGCTWRRLPATRMVYGADLIAAGWNRTFVADTPTDQRHTLANVAAFARGRAFRSLDAWVQPTACGDARSANPL